MWYDSLLCGCGITVLMGAGHLLPTPSVDVFDDIYGTSCMIQRAIKKPNEWAEMWVIDEGISFELVLNWF